MNEISPIHPSDFVGFSRLAIDGTMRLVDVVEAMHLNISHSPAILGAPLQGSTRGITGLVYRSIRAATGLVGAGLDALLVPLAAHLGERDSPPGREATLAALNGVIGDHLAATRNPLAITMTLRHNGKPLSLERRALARTIPGLSNKLLVMAHGLCMSDLQWTRKGHNHADALARDLDYTPVYLNYNSGLHTSTNGRSFAALIERLVAQWPLRLKDVVIIGHSMGGLVARSAFHHASATGHAWPHSVRKMVFLGTPHHGASLERGGNWLNVVLGLSPYTAALGSLGKIRSAGITDLRYGNVMDEDWAGRDRFRPLGDVRQPMPLPEKVHCYAIAAALTGKERCISRLAGDGLVPLYSALGRHKDPRRALAFDASRQRVVYGRSHFDLLNEPAVYQQMKTWLAPGNPARPRAAVARRRDDGRLAGC